MIARAHFERMGFERMGFARIALRVAGCGLALAGVACGDDSAGTGGGGAGGSAQQGSPTGQGGTQRVGCGPVTDRYAAAACSECAEAACCDELLACSDDTPCFNVVNCQDGCGDDGGCMQACEDKYAGVEKRDALDDCMAAACETECAAPPGYCGTEFTTTIPACDACIDGACCDEVGACIADEACASCLSGNVDESCDGIPVYDAVIECFADGCSDVCEG